MVGFSTTLTSDAVAVARDLHVLEQAGGVKALERGIERRGVDCPVGRGMEIGPDHVGADMPVAGNRDRGIGKLESACRRGGMTAGGDREKSGKDDDKPPATHHARSPSQSGRSQPSAGAGP